MKTDACWIANNAVIVFSLRGRRISPSPRFYGRPVFRSNGARLILAAHPPRALPLKGNAGSGMHPAAQSGAEYQRYLTGARVARDWRAPSE